MYQYLYFFRRYNSFQKANCQRSEFIQFFVSIVIGCVGLHNYGIPNCVSCAIHVSKVSNKLRFHSILNKSISKYVFLNFPLFFKNREIQSAKFELNAATFWPKSLFLRNNFEYSSSLKPFREYRTPRAFYRSRQGMSFQYILCICKSKSFYLFKKIESLEGSKKRLKNCILMQNYLHLNCKKKQFDADFFFSMLEGINI